MDDTEEFLTEDEVKAWVGDLWDEAQWSLARKDDQGRVERSYVLSLKGGENDVTPAPQEGALGSGSGNFEYEKSVVFRKLDPSTTDEDMRAALGAFGALDYCYVAKDDAGASKRLGRAKFRAEADAEADAALSKDQAILAARERAVNNAIAACESLDRTALGGGEVIRVERSRPADWKEYKRYGDY